MQITLISGFYIETDNRNFTLKQKYIGMRKDGTKKESVKIISHCGSLEQALETFLRMNQIPHDSKLAFDLMEYVNLVEQSNKDGVQALKSVWEGTHDDVCEWKFEETNGIAWHCDEKCTTYNQFYIKDLKIVLEDFECRCPYCGKKIKVVE